MIGRYERQPQLFLAALLWAAIAIGSATTTAAAAPSTSRHLAAGVYGRLQAGRLVDVRNLAPAARASSAPDLPVLTRNPRALSAIKASRTTSSTVASRIQQTAGPLTASPPVEEELTDFPGMSLQQQTAALGPSEALQPPDTQVAAGPGLLMEMDNRTGSFWTKAGVLATTTGPNPFDLQPFFVPSPGPALCPSTTCPISDPRLLFDADSGRWLASVAGFNPGVGSTVFLGLSSGSDPTGTWTIFSLQLYGLNPRVVEAIVADAPTLGASHDKVTIAWDAFLFPGEAPCPTTSPVFCFAGQQAVVIDKGQLLAGAATPATFVIGPVGSQFGFMPVQSLTSSTTAYIVYNNADPTFLTQNQPVPSLGLIAITGIPSANNVTFTEADLPLTSGTTAPPDAAQMGSSRLVSTDDDRLNSATWQNGTLWTSAGIGCGGLDANSIPKGACLRMWQVSTAGIPIVSQDFFLLGAGGGAGDYLYDPAQSVDSLGNMFLVFSHSNASSFPGAMIAGQPVGSAAGSLTPLLTLQAGQGPFDPIAGGCSTVSRWGDYAAVAQDPTDPTDVWVGSEFTPSATDPCLWGTTIGRLTFSGPSITSAAPLTGSKFGGTGVVINGRDFLPGGTSVVFDQSPSPAVSVTPDQITTTSPAHLAATVPLTVSTPNGKASVQFTYLPRAEAATAVPGSTARAGRPVAPPVPQVPPGPRKLVAGQPLAPTDNAPVGASPSAAGATAASATDTLGLTEPVWLAIQQAVLRLIGILMF